LKNSLFLAVVLTATGARSQTEIDTGLPLGPYSSGDSISRELSVERAARFLDEVSSNWGNRKGCVTCHTNGYYLTAPASIFADRPAFREVRAFAEGFVGTWDENPPETYVLVATAAFLAMSDAGRTEAPGPATRMALDRAWARQSDEGHWPDWIKCNWPPFESDDHYGVTLMAIAMGMTKDSYRDAEPARSALSRMLRYLEAHPPSHAHQKAMLLWASRYHHGLIEEGERDRWTSELSLLQRADGGWASGDLGSWRQRDGSPSEPPVHVESDGYGTGFVLFVLMQAGVPPSGTRIRRGIAWLETHQRSGGYWWTQSLRNESDTSNYLTHAGTTFALKALEAAGASVPASEGAR
jgi:squalene-hopene/tetraprenyl-beta-curcumene cyclase